MIPFWCFFSFFQHLRLSFVVFTNKEISFSWLQFMRMALSHQPCERLLGNPRRQLIHEGPVTLMRKSVMQLSMIALLVWLPLASGTVYRSL